MRGDRQSTEFAAIEHYAGIGRTVDMQQLRAVKLDLDTMTFVEAWQRWRGSRLLPEKSDIQLPDIKRSLSTIAMFQVVDDDTVLIRLAGTRLADISGFEPTWRNYKTITRPEDWPVRRQHFLNMTSQPCGGYMKLILPGDGEPMELESVNLPISAPEPHGRPLMLCCNTPLTRILKPVRRGEGRSIPAATGFVYVDIGGGVPDVAAGAAITRSP